MHYLGTNRVNLPSYTGNAADVSLRKTAEHKLPNPARATNPPYRYMPALVVMRLRGNGTFSVTLRNITQSTDIKTFPSDPNGHLDLECIDARKLSNMPTFGEELGFSITLGTASRVTPEDVITGLAS